MPKKGKFCQKLSEKRQKVPLFVPLRKKNFACYFVHFQRCKTVGKIILKKIFGNLKKGRIFAANKNDKDMQTMEMEIFSVISLAGVELMLIELPKSWTKREIRNYIEHALQCKAYSVKDKIFTNL